MTATRKAFSLVEIIIAVAIVGGMLAAALTALGSSRVAQFRTGQLRQAHLLAEALMDEVRSLPYDDPDGGALLGTDTGELGLDRLSFDDVDDYDGWSSTPPQLKGGTPLDQFAGYGRSVVVEYVNPGNPNQTIPSDGGIKRITVTVTYAGGKSTTLEAIRTRARDTLTAE